jgi:hypothetical protein
VEKEADILAAMAQLSSRQLLRLRMSAHAESLQYLSRHNSATSRTIATAAVRKQSRLPAAYYRGGTSRAIMFDERLLPKDKKDWVPIFTGTIGAGT